MPIAMGRALHLPFMMWVVIAGLAACGGCSDGGEKPPVRVPTPVDPSMAGSIRGLVRFNGTPPPRKVLQTGGDAACAQDPPPLEERAIVVSDKSGRQVVQNAFVWIKGGLKDFVPPVPDAPVVVDQSKCIFVPHVVGVQRYQTLRFTNSDQTEHNVKFIEPGRNPSHDKTMTGAGQKLDFWFPEEAAPPMKIVCNKHSWMRCFVAVCDHPYFAVTGPDGAFDLKGVPPGSYTVGCWTEGFGTKDLPAKVDAKGVVEIEFPFAPQ